MTALCSDCRYGENLLGDEPCRTCFDKKERPAYIKKISAKTKANEKRCEHCKYGDWPFYFEPCSICLYDENRRCFIPKKEDLMSMDRCCANCVHCGTPNYIDPCAMCLSTDEMRGFMPKSDDETDKPSLEEELYPRHIESNDPLHPGHYPFVGSEDPIDVCLKWGIGFCEGNVIKYVVRWKKKGGIEDLKKARIYLDRLIEHHENNIEKEA